MNNETNTTDPVIQYSAESEISNPINLIRGMLRDFSAGRELAGRLFVRNLRGLYRQTLLGLFWAFLPPIVNTAFWVFLREAADQHDLLASVYRSVSNANRRDQQKQKHDQQTEFSTRVVVDGWVW